MHVSQIIMLYILSLYCVICQLYLNITGKRNEEAKKKKRERERKGEKEKGGRIKRVVDLKLKPTVLNLTSITNLKCYLGQIT